MEPMISNLFKCNIIHNRFVPFNNYFKYKMLSLYIDYDELKDLTKKLTFFSYNKFNIFSFHDKDHGFRDGRSLRLYIVNFLKKNKIKYKDLRIKILCFPSILGYVFNPLSVIFCFDNENLFAIFYEVKNTSNEQHTYCFANYNHKNKISFKHKCNKIFYVSPFIKMDCYYQFSIKIPKDEISVAIEVFDKSNKRIIFASQNGKKIKLSSFSLLKQLLINPLVIYKVISLILYQSVKIFLKGGKYYARNKKLTDSISFEGTQ